MKQEKTREVTTRFFRIPSGSPNDSPFAPALALLMVLGLLVSCPCLTALPADAKILDQVVATVNEDLITQSELNEGVELYMHQLDKMQNRSLSDMERKSIERRMLEEIIDKTIMENYAQDMGIGATKEEIDRAIEDVIVRANITQTQLQQALERDGIRYEEYRDQIQNQIIKAKLIHREVGSRIEIKEAEIESYYLDHPEEFSTEEGVMLRHVLLPLPPKPDPTVIEENRKKALNIQQEIQSGMPFEEAAAKYSLDTTAAQGGRLGFFRKGDMNPEMEQAVWALKEGEVSGPIRSQIGIHLIKLEEKTSGEPRPLEKVRETIREKLYEEAAERQFEDWRKELRKNAHIEVFL